MDQHCIFPYAFNGQNEVLCYVKKLQTDSFLTAKEKLEAWKKARELEICPKFRLLTKDPLENPPSINIDVESEMSFGSEEADGNKPYWLVTEAGVTLEFMLEQEEQNLLQLYDIKNKINKIGKKLQRAKLAHQDIKPANCVIIGSNFYLIDMEHIRAFGKARTVQTFCKDTRGVPYDNVNSKSQLLETTCSMHTDAQAF